jgi:hypothetical protein
MVVAAGAAKGTTVYAAGFVKDKAVGAAGAVKDTADKNIQIPGGLV